MNRLRILLGAGVICGLLVSYGGRAGAADDIYYRGGAWGGGVAGGQDNAESGGARGSGSDVVYITENCVQWGGKWASLCCVIKSDKESCEKSTHKTCVAASRAKIKRDYEEVSKGHGAAPACAGTM